MEKHGPILVFRRGIKGLTAATLVCLAVGCGTGCLSRPSLVRETFAFPPPSAAPTAPAPGDRVLAIQKLTVEAPFDSPSLVYRSGEFSYEPDPYAGFLASPSESLLAPIREFFRSSGKFHALTEPGSALKADILLEINVTQLYGDFRNPGPPAAVLGLRLHFFDFPNGVPGKLLSAQSYLQRVTMAARTPAALVEGWNQALTQVLGSIDFAFAAHPDLIPQALLSVPQVR